MKIRLGLLVLTIIAGAVSVEAQRLHKRTVVKKDTVKVMEPTLAESYADSLSALRARIDSIQPVRMDSDDSRFAKLFTPLTFYRSPANRFLRLKPQAGVGDSLDVELDAALLDIYLRRPDLVKVTQRHLEEVGAPIVADNRNKKQKRDIIEDVAPKAIEPDAAPMDIVIFRPNFWTFAGDYYLQFLQNYVSDNWYKGGESNYSLLGRLTMQANYNNKQKVKWENKLEMRLGYQTSKGDSVHSLKTSDDLIRYTSKLGLQASRKWYYTIQMVAQTQFAHGYKSNDKFGYSDFFSPFNLNLSVGMDYSVDWLNHRVKGSAHLAPLALNWKYVGRERRATR